MNQYAIVIALGERAPNKFSINITATDVDTAQLVAESLANSMPPQQVFSSKLGKEITATWYVYEITEGKES